MLYGTTRRFLEVFGLENLKNLPTLRELDEMAREQGLLDPPVGTEGATSDDDRVGEAAEREASVPETTGAAASEPVTVEAAPDPEDGNGSSSDPGTVTPSETPASRETDGGRESAT